MRKTANRTAVQMAYMGVAAALFFVALMVMFGLYPDPLLLLFTALTFLVLAMYS